MARSLATLMMALGAAAAPSGVLPEAPPGDVSSDEAALREMLERGRIDHGFTLIQEFNHPHAWTDLGGSELSLHHIGGEWVVEMHPAAETSGGGPSPRAMKEEVEAFIRLYRPILDGRPPEEVVATVPLGFRDTPENERTREQMRARRITANFTDEPLLRALLEIERQAGLDIEPDWKALAEADATPATPITMRAVDEPLGDVLGRVGEALSGEFDPARLVIERGRIVLTTETNRRLHVATAVYDLREIISMHRRAVRYEEGAGPTDTEIVQNWMDNIVELIDPGGWVVCGGDTGLVNVIDTWLFIRNTPDVHRRIEQLTEASLAAARGEARIVTMWRDPFRHDPATETRLYDLREVFALQMRLLQPGEAFWLTDYEVVDRWLDVMQEFIDPHNWRNLGGDVGTVMTFAHLMIVQQTPQAHRQIERLMNAMVTVGRGRARSVNLGPDPFNDRDEVVEIRVYEVSDIIEAMTRAGGERAAWNTIAWNLIEAIMESIDPDNWRDHGGDVGMIHEYGGLFIIANTPANHEAIERFLNAARSRSP